jgi:hypothetical protein
MSDPALNKAITLIRSGNTGTARQILTEMLRHNPDHEQAWLWISKCFDEPARKKYCFERVLKANPDNPIARKALRAMNASGALEETTARPVRRIQPDETSERAGAQPLLAAVVSVFKRSSALRFLVSLAMVMLIAVVVWAVLSSLFPKNIPITPAQLKSHLTAIGVFCSSVERTERNTSYAYVMHCNGYSDDGRAQIAVDVYSKRDARKVNLILAYVTQQNSTPSAEVMGGVLSHVAMLPYKHADPSQVGAWVQRNFPLLLSGALVEDPIAEFGRVQFHLASLSPTRKYLAIGEGQD